MIKRVAIAMARRLRVTPWEQMLLLIFLITFSSITNSMAVVISEDLQIVSPVQGSVFAPGQTFTVIVSVAAGSSFTEIGVLGGKGIGDDIDDTRVNSLMVSAVNTNAGPMAFALYHAPVDFARPDVPTDSEKSQRSISIRVNDSKDFSIKIVRPPVALIHGIWSNPDTWEFFNPLTEGKTISPRDDQRFRIRRIDYDDTSFEGFEKNGKETLKQLRSFINTFKRKEFRVAAVQTDVVAYSMGGNIARTWVLNASFLRSQNYNQGEIHKLITLHSPHLGTAFADRLLDSSELCKDLFSTFKKQVAGAVTDLSTHSQKITSDLKQVIYPIKSHVIVGIANTIQESETEFNFRILQFVASIVFADPVCENLLPSGGFKDVFAPPNDLGPKSDLIVSQGSQAASGLGYPDGSPLNPSNNIFDSPGFIHAVDPYLFNPGPDALSRALSIGNIAGVQTPYPRRVIELLNKPVTSDAFSSILP